MLRFLVFITFLFFILQKFVHAQELPFINKYPQGYFGMPLKLSPSLAGNFGELRSAHFHTGLDLKTNQREGYPVYAIANGYVSRISVKERGYGNAVYITHPNGYTSVYAHLSRFVPKTASIVKKKQYAAESFEVDFNPGSDRIKVKKGELIAYSGNTGGSQGPHLHFELRDAETEEAINPLLFGLPVRDSKKPVIYSFHAYPLNDSSSVNDLNVRTDFVVHQIEVGKYILEGAQDIYASGDIGFGISACDSQDGSINKNGIFSIEIMHDGNLVYKSEMERISFGLQRMVNSYIDYAFYKSKHRYINKCFLQKGNKLKIYKNIDADGAFSFSDSALHKFKIIVKDVSGNASSLSFNVKSLSYRKKYHFHNSDAQFFAWDEENILSTDSINLNFPEKSFYDNIFFQYGKSPSPAAAWSALHNVHNKYEPVNKPYEIRIKPYANMPHQDKAVIMNDEGKAYAAVYEDGYIKAKLNALGSFYVTVDTVSPVIKPLNIYDGKNMAATSSIRIRINDKMSGIKDYRGYIDGSWVLFEYDPKTSTLTHVFDGRVSKGQHRLNLVVTDRKGNKANYRASFHR